MRILALDTSTEACSAALLSDGEISADYRVAPREHAKLILPMIDALLTEAEVSPNALDAIAFGRGPGSFTGVRIGTSVAQGIAYGADIPLVPVSTLASMALGVMRRSDATGVFTAIDARMNEVYAAAWSVDPDGLPLETLSERVCPADGLQLPDDGPYFGAGSGWASYRESLTAAGSIEGVDAEVLPDARDMLPLAAAAIERGEAVGVVEAQPVYLRDKVTHQGGKR